jgi:chromosome segregation ATPase
LALRKKLFDDEEAWEARKKDELLQLDATYEVKKQKALQELQTLCDEEMDKRLSDEHDWLQEEMDRHIGLMQDENEKLISGLEQAMGNLRTEKTGLTIELEKLTNKLEETEDTLYDLQQECKKILQDSSLTVWKAITKITHMRIHFQEDIAQFDLEAACRYEEIKRNMQVEQNAIMLAV